MLTIEIFEDGSGLMSRPGKTPYLTENVVLSPGMVQRQLMSVCKNSEEGCGMCPVCKTKEAFERMVKVSSLRRRP